MTIQSRARKKSISSRKLQSLEEKQRSPQQRSNTIVDQQLYKKSTKNIFAPRSKDPKQRLFFYSAGKKVAMRVQKNLDTRL